MHPFAAADQFLFVSSSLCILQILFDFFPVSRRLGIITVLVVASSTHLAGHDRYQGWGLSLLCRHVVIAVVYQAGPYHYKVYDLCLLGCHILLPLWFASSDLCAKQEGSFPVVGM